MTEQLYLVAGLPTITAWIGILVIGHFVSIHNRLILLEGRLTHSVNKGDTHG